MATSSQIPISKSQAPAAAALTRSGAPREKLQRSNSGTPSKTGHVTRHSSLVTPCCIHHIFERQVAKTPGAIAVKCGEETLTYNELNLRADRLAQQLSEMGVAPEVRVALYLERSLDMVVAILGVMKAGGAYVPIDLAYPKERLSFMLEDSEAPVLLTQQKLREAIPHTDARVLCLDSDEGCVSREGEPAPHHESGSTDLSRRSQTKAEPETHIIHHPPSTIHDPSQAAYIIYTSGSTGKPKGVIVTHHNVVRLLKQTEPWYQFNSTDVWPLFHSYAFDVSVWELWGSLFHGGRLVIVPYLVTRSPADFYELLANEKVTVLNQTPSAFRQLIWAEATAQTKHPLRLRYVICAGEALELQSLKPWFELHGDEKPLVVNMYGITETTVHSTYRPIRKSDLENGAGSVIGVPIPDLPIYLVDENLQPVPPGVPGEICVGGAGVARGYLNRPELTGQRFLRDPFSDEPGARLYRSGDLAQYSTGGELEYLGRMDHQVKIRGFRVELGEIESALNRHPAIRESVVLARETPTGEKRLIGYLVPAQSAPTTTELRQYLAEHIPDYMIPAAFINLKSLPLNTNGKVDRRALPAPDRARPELGNQFVAPRTATEQALAAIWSEVLEVEPVGAEDNFFELGGDSIRSIRVLSKAHEQGMNLSLEQIFQFPTVAGLAAGAENSAGRATFIQTAAFALLSNQDRTQLPEEIEDAYPLTRLQMGMFFSNDLDPISAIYHDIFSFRVQSAFDQQALEQALHHVVERHPVLRTSFHLAGFSEPLQLVHREARVPFSFEDLTALSAEEQQQQLVGWVEAEKRRPFDRTVAPLVRFHVQLRSPDCFQFILSFHHVCLDGWSLAAVMTEILQEYSALKKGAEETIAPPRLAYREYVGLEKQAIESAASRGFWAEKLRDAGLQLLPRWPKSMCESGHEQKRGPELQIDPKLLEALKRLAQAAGVPLKTVLLAAHQRVMALLYGQNDVTSGLLCNGRPEEIDGEKLIGLFLNLLPVRVKLGGGNWMDLVRQTFAAEQEIIPHRRFPLAEIQKLNGGQPLFEAGFDFVHFHVYKNLEGNPGLGFLEDHYFEANNLTAFTTFMLDVTSTQLQMHIDYDPNVLCREQVEQFSNYYVNTLQAMASDPLSRYEPFSALSASEKQRLLIEWNATQEDFPRNKCIHELFEERVSAAPDTVAVVCGDASLTYGELNRRADALAQRLRALLRPPLPSDRPLPSDGRGIKGEGLVGICMDRSPEMLVGMLGILKAGAAYVPLDPSFPKERLTFMLEDANVPILVTQTSLLPFLPATDAKILCIDHQTGRVGDRRCVRGPTSVTNHGTRNTEHVPLPPPPSSLAYVIYTSGSTGKPKGVQISHQAVVNLLISAARTIGAASSDNFLAVTTLSFDIAGLELFMPLITGGRITLAAPEQAGDGTRLAALLESSRATMMQGTPATWRLLIEAGWQGNKDLKVICGGEALTRKLADELLERAAEVWNFYGPTETTIWSTAWKVAAGETVSIGRPLANTQLYILDQGLRPLPVGAVGELHIGGLGLARGYLNRPELTGEKFIPNPFGDLAGGSPLPSDRPLPSDGRGIKGEGIGERRGIKGEGPGVRGEGRLYKTGDLARHLPDGRVECLGRIDHQVKIRGFRIELGEIETVLRQHAHVAEALVHARENGAGEKKLIGYIVSKNGPVSSADFRDFVGSKLPPYMVPAQFVLLEKFPLTANGKIDVRSLHAPDRSTEPTRNYIAPRNDTEQHLVEIWREVLHLKQVGIEDNFFELGGDSLSATRAFARINQQLGAAITLREILDHPTIASLAEIVRNSKGASTARLGPIRRQPRVPITS